MGHTPPPEFSRSAPVGEEGEGERKRGEGDGGREASRDRGGGEKFIRLSELTILVTILLIS